MTLTKVDRTILDLLKSRGPMSYVEIKRATGLHRSYLYDSLTKLRAMGLIDFELRGIRTKIYYLTEAGRAVAEGKDVEAVTRQKKVDVDVLISVMTPSDAKVLRVMTLRKIPMSLNDIRIATGLGRAQTNFAVRRLISYGLIEAERKDNKVLYRLTEEGEALAEKLVEAIEAKEEAYRILESVLDKVLKVIRMGISPGEIYRELKLYELERKKRSVS